MKPWNGISSTPDSTVTITCDCGEEIFIGDSTVTRCLKCDKGYRTELLYWQYESGEFDPEYIEDTLAHERLEKWFAEASREYHEKFMELRKSERI